MKAIRRRRRGAARLGRSMAIALGASSVLAATSTSPAFAAGPACQTEPIRRAEPYGLTLPDCRAYEQVSPIDKNGADAQGKPRLTESAPSGDQVAYFSLLPFPGVEGAAEFPTYLSSFSGDTWSTQGLLPPSNPASPTTVLALTEDLRYTIVEVGPLGPLLGEASIQGEEGLIDRATLGERNYYIRNNRTNEYHLLAPGTHPYFVDASQDGSAILFEDRAKLTEKATSFLNAEGNEESATGTNLYEWNAGIVTLVGLVPRVGQPTCGSSGPSCVAPGDGAVGGPGGQAITESEFGMEEPKGLPGGATSGFELQDTMSEDGSRVFFTDVTTGQIYMREPMEGRTVAVSSGVGPAYWRAATPDGAFAFYTEGEGEDRNLYRFIVAGERREAVTTGEAHVLGTLGVSDDGTYAYFVAEGVLATNENGHVIEPETGEKEKAVLGQPNLYEWHNGKIQFIVKLRRKSDRNNWTDFAAGGAGAAEGMKDSRVSENGTTVLFASEEQISPYNNNKRDNLYLYDAQRPLSANNPTCVSCNFNAKESSTPSFLANHFIFIYPNFRNEYMTRNLSSDGTRVFFESEEALVPNDTNSQMDVYEWEREGHNSCKRDEGGTNGGCLYLISTGQAPEGSYFGDASSDGSNIFFFTRQSLVTQDSDDNVDIYDAREDGGLEGQNTVPGGQCEDDGCRSVMGLAPSLSVPASLSLSGPGNVIIAPAESAKGKIKRVAGEQKLTVALRKCKKKSKRRRAECRAHAHRRYGANATASHGRDE